MHPEQGDAEVISVSGAQRYAQTPPAHLAECFSLWASTGCVFQKSSGGTTVGRGEKCEPSVGFHSMKPHSLLHKSMAGP